MASEFFKKTLNFLKKLNDRFLIKMNTNYNDYNHSLYLLGKESTFIIGEKRIRGTIKEVGENGDLKLCLENDIKSLKMKEISYTI